MKQATFFATITDTTPGIITALLARADGDPATASTATAPPDQAPPPAPPRFRFHHVAG